MVLSGGVAANLRLREKMNAACEKRKIECIRTPMPYCTDNAAMVAGLALQLIKNGNEKMHPGVSSMDAYANIRIGSPRSHRTGERL